MKSCNEMVNSLMERLDAYEVQQKRKRKTVMRITSVACAFAVVAAVGVGLWQGGVFDTEVPPVIEAPSYHTPSAPTSKVDNAEGCTVHQGMYHAISGNFEAGLIEKYFTYCKDKTPTDESCTEVGNIIEFVQWAGITREEYIESQGPFWTTDNLDEIAWNHGKGCPYTKNQFLDAVYGDNEELSAWVFATIDTWPKADKWSVSGEEGQVPENWPPEGYGFGEVRPTTEPTTSEPTTEPTIIVTQPITPSTTDSDWELSTAGRDEFGNTTAKP